MTVSRASDIRRECEVAHIVGRQRAVPSRPRGCRGRPASNGRGAATQDRQRLTEPHAADRDPVGLLLEVVALHADAAGALAALRPARIGDRRPACVGLQAEDRDVGLDRLRQHVAREDDPRTRLQAGDRVLRFAPSDRLAALGVALCAGKPHRLRADQRDAALLPARGRARGQLHHDHHERGALRGSSRRS